MCKEWHKRNDNKELHGSRIKAGEGGNKSYQGWVVYNVIAFKFKMVISNWDKARATHSRVVQIKSEW